MSSASVTRFAGRSGPPNAKAQRRFAWSLPLLALGLAAFNLVVMARGGLGGIELVVSLLFSGAFIWFASRGLRQIPAQLVIGDGQLKLSQGRRSRSLSLAGAELTRHKWTTRWTGTVGAALVVRSHGERAVIGVFRAAARGAESVEEVDLVLELDELDELERALLRAGAALPQPATREPYRRAELPEVTRFELVANAGAGSRTWGAMLIWTVTMALAILAGNAVYELGAGSLAGGAVALALVVAGIAWIMLRGARQSPGLSLVLRDDDVVLTEPGKERQLARASLEEIVAERRHMRVPRTGWKVPTLVLRFPERNLLLGCADPKASWALDTTAGPAPEFWVGPAEWSELCRAFQLDDA